MKVPQLILLFLAFIGLSLFAYKRLSFDTDPLKLLPQDMPEVRGIQLYQKHFSRQVDLIIAVEGEDDEVVDRATNTLGEFLHDDRSLAWRVAWNPPGLGNALDFNEIIAYSWWNADPAAVEMLAASLTPESTEAVLEEAVDTMASSFDAEEIVKASTDPLGITDILKDVIDLDERGKTRIGYSSDDGLLRLIFIDAPGDNYEYKESLKWLEDVRTAVEKLQREGKGGLDQVSVRYTGNGPYIAEVSVQMQNEMVISAIVTITIIVGLFWFFYRCTTPLFWLTFCLLFTFVLTVALGSLIYGKLGAMSVGFAAILVGLCVDYGFIVYQEWAANPDITPSKLRRKIFYSIAWASGTTATVFFGLNLSRVPGAAQLGTMVAIGIIAGSIIMMTIFPWLISLSSGGGRGRTSGFRKLPPLPALPKTAIGLAFTAIVLATLGRPGLSTDEKTLEPKRSVARDTWQQISKRMGQNDKEAVYVIFQGENPEDLLKNMEKVKAATAGREDMETAFPIAFLPHRESQKANRPVLFELTNHIDRIEEQASEAGLTEEATALASAVFKQWRQWGKKTKEGDTVYPRYYFSRELLNNFLSVGDENESPLAMGRFVFDEINEVRIEAEISQLAEENNGLIVSWSQLSPAIRELIQSEKRSVLLPLSLLVLVMLVLAFRRLRDVTLSVSTFIYSGLLMIAIMTVTDLKWNIVNLAAVPLLLGAGLDYSIHMLMAVRRLKDDVEEAKQTIGRALLLCGLSSVTGFTTVAFSTNHGLSQLGIVCATGIFLTMITAVFLLPGWADAWNKVNLKMKGESKNPQIS